MGKKKKNNKDKKLLSLLLMRLVFDFLKYAVETYNKITAICDQAYANEDDEGQLMLAYLVSCTSFKIGEVARRSRYLVVPRYVRR
jgi:hypothetical protein